MLRFRGSVLQSENCYALGYADRSGQAVAVEIPREIMTLQFGVFDPTLVDVADCAFEIAEVASRKYRGVSPIVLERRDFWRL